MFTYTQELLNRYSKVTDPEHTAQVVDIHHDYGYAKLFPDGSITLTWNNGQYRFILESRGMTLDELVKVARDIAPPERIVEVRGPSGLSPTITQTVLTQNESMVMLEYSRDDMLIGRFMQTLRWNEEAEYDPGCEMTNVSIGAYTGVLLTYPDGRRTVIWNDASYRYQLESTSMPTEVIIAWAASVRAIDIEEQSPIATAPPSTIKEERKPKKLTGGIREMSTVKEKDSVTVRYQKNGKEVAVFVQRVIEDDAYLDGITYRSLWFFEYGIVYLSGERDEQLLLWTDGEYYYEIQSDILSPDDLLIFAKSMME